MLRNAIRSKSHNRTSSSFQRCYRSENWVYAYAKPGVAPTCGEKSQRMVIPLAHVVGTKRALHFLREIINTSCQKLPFGSGDDPDKLEMRFSRHI